MSVAFIRLFQRVLLAPLYGVRAVFRTPRHSLPALATAAMVVLAFPPFHFYPLLLCCLVPVMFVAREVSLGRAFTWGWFSGALITGVGFSFIYTLLVVFGHMPGYVAFPIHILFAFYQGLVIAFFALLFAMLCRVPWLSPVIATPLAYVVAEFCCREFFIFPWYLGNAAYPFVVFIQIADLLGGFGVTAVIAALNGMLFEVGRWWVVRRQGGETVFPKRSVVAGVVLFVATVVYGQIRIAQVDAVTADQPTIRVGLVEADIGIMEKAHPEDAYDNLLTHQRLSADLAAQGAELIVWPETSVNIHAWASRYVVSTEPTDDLDLLSQTVRPMFGRLSRDVTYFPPSDAPFVANLREERQRGTPLEAVATIQRGFRVPVLFGVVTERPPTPAEAEDMPPHRPTIAFNTGILIDADGRVLGSYDKNVLLVFGEYVPFATEIYRLFGVNVIDMIANAPDITPGGGVEVLELPFEVDGESLTVRIGGLVCYEDIIAEYGLALAEKQPNILVNIINDGWFGESAAALHHMAFSVLRSVEHRLPLVRATNTGISSFIDPAGRVTSRTAITGRETLIADVPIMPPPTTVYSRVGDVLPWLALLGLSVVLFTERRRFGRRRARADGACAP